MCTPGQQKALAGGPAVITDAPVKGEHRSQIISGERHPELSGDREEMYERCDNDARVDTTQCVPVVGEQQTQIKRQR